MSPLAAVVSTIGGLIVLAGVGGGLWAVFRSSAQDARIKRLQDERDDYLSRLNYIEPRHRALEQQNEYLLALHDPSAKLDSIGDDQGETLRILRGMHTIIQQIDRHLMREERET